MHESAFDKMRIVQNTLCVYIYEQATNSFLILIVRY